MLVNNWAILKELCRGDFYCIYVTAVPNCLYMKRLLYFAKRTFKKNYKTAITSSHLFKVQSIPTEAKTPTLPSFTPREMIPIMFFYSGCTQSIYGSDYVKNKDVRSCTMITIRRDTQLKNSFFIPAFIILWPFKR